MKRARPDDSVTITYFATPALLRAWLEEHHAVATELWVGFHKKDSGVASITWPESVDAALCFGWIDGIRKGIDSARCKIRFTPASQQHKTAAGGRRALRGLRGFRRSEGVPRRFRIRPAPD